MDFSILSQLLVNMISISAIYILLSLGLSLIYRVSKVFHFAHGAIYTLGAYLFFTFMVQMKFPLVISVMIAVLIAAIIGFGVDRIIYYPLVKRNVSGAAFLIASLGVYIFLESLIALIYGAEIKVLLPGVQRTLSLGKISVTFTQLIEIFIVILVILFVIWIKQKPIGLWFRSVANDETMALSLGLPISRIRSSAFLIGSALAALAACLAALDSGAEPHMGMQALFVAIVSVFVGGYDIFLGPLVGGLLFSALQVGGNYFLSSRWEKTIAFIILLIIMTFRPEGILSRKRRIEERAGH